MEFMKDIRNTDEYKRLDKLYRADWNRNVYKGNAYNKERSRFMVEIDVYGGNIEYGLYLDVFSLELDKEWNRLEDAYAETRKNLADLEIECVVIDFNKFR